jgi:hypothetical protein
MAAKKRNENSQEEKRASFARMATTYKECIAAQNFIAAHVLAFSFLEDRITAMDVVLGRTQEVDRSGYSRLSQRLKRLEQSSDLCSDLAKRIQDAGDKRNALIHAAMWNLSVFSAENAHEALALAREADNARGKQKKRLKQ